MSECVNCEAEGTIKHHVNYQEERTVRLCPSCHQTVHGNPNHRLYPEDENPDDTIQITATFESGVFKKLQEVKGWRSWKQALLEELVEGE